MTNAKDGKTLALDLCRSWEEMLEEGGLSSEVEYRIKKMSDRMKPIVNKIYVKTVKASEMIQQCSKKTQDLNDQLKTNGDRIYIILTELEKKFETLLNNTYEFRIKAG